MAAKEVQIQPRLESGRKQPPKAQDLQNEQAMIHAKAAASAAAAAGVEPVQVAEGKFEDPATIFHGVAPTAPSQEALAAKALESLPKSEEGQPVVQQAQTGAIMTPATQVLLVPTVENPPKAPSTVGELKAQRARLGNERFPDVGDIFAGKIPNEKPINGPVTIQKAPEPIVIRKEVVITHAIQDPNQAMICLKECDVYIRDSMVHFVRDQLVTDFSQIDAIRLSNSPNFAPYGELDTFEHCPHCGNRFPGKNSAVKYGS